MTTYIKNLYLRSYIYSDQSRFYGNITPTDILALSYGNIFVDFIISDNSLEVWYAYKD